jgi:hypothetical protein
VHHETKISDLLEHLPWNRGLLAPVTFDRAVHRDSAMIKLAEIAEAEAKK